MEQNKYTEKEIQKLRDEQLRFDEVAKTHMIKTDFYWIAGIFMTLSLMGFTITMNRISSHVAEDKIEFDQIKDENTTFQVTYATIQTTLLQIQKDIAEIKLKQGK